MNEQKNNAVTVGSKTDWEFFLQIGIVIVLAVLLFYNFGGTGNVTGGAIGTVSALDIAPKGVPAVYGKELGISYDDVSPNNPKLADAAIQKLSAYENEKLTSEQMVRYKKIGGSIACEYCCGAETLIFSSGERACGCAHSYSMRGLAKYLLIKHPDMTDEQILEELGKWKVLFFPGVHQQKAQVLKSQGIELNYINLASNKYRGIEQGQASDGAMVGGC